MYFNRKMEDIYHQIEEIEEKKKSAFMFEAVEYDEDISLLLEDLHDEAINQYGRLEELYESGQISKDDYYEMEYEMMESLMEIQLKEEPYFMEAVEAKSLSTIKGELKQFNSKIGKSIASCPLFKVITHPVKTYLLSRIRKYPELHSDAINIEDMDSAKYDYSEVSNKYQFREAKTWAKDPKCKCKVSVYEYNKKEQCVIAVGRTLVAAGQTATTNCKTEVIMISPETRRHTEYYTAAMCAQEGIMHPSIKRVHDKLKQEWEKESRKLEKTVKESVVLYGGIEEKEDLIDLAYRENAVTLDEMLEYVGYLREEVIEIGD